MTATTTEAGVARYSTSRAKDAPPAKPTREQVIEAVMREAHAANVLCSIVKAEALIKMLEAAVKDHRLWPSNLYHLGDWEMRNLHGVLDVVMVDHAANPDPGSAHDLANRYMLEGNEISIVHTRNPAYEGKLIHCAVMLQVDAA